MSKPLPCTTLSNRQLNRALLARQHLLERRHIPATEVIEQLVGMQSQAPNGPYFGLWSRIEDFETAELGDAMLARETVRMVTMRGTIHLLTARDALSFWPVVQAMLEASFGNIATYAPNLEGLDLAEVIEAGRLALEAAPQTGKQLGVILRERWPDRDAAALSHAVRNHLPLVQVTPPWVWGKSQQPTLNTIQAWLGRPISARREPDELIRRYLAGFGPATVADIQAWSGLSGLRESVVRLRPGLAVYRDERGRELFDIPDAPLPDPETPAPVRFFPGFENALLAHADRTRIISDERRKATCKVNGLVDPTFLLDGYVGGRWKAVRAKTEVAIDLFPFEPLARSDRDDVESEATRLLDFFEPAAVTREIRFHEPGL